MASFVDLHKDMLTQNLSRPVDHVRCVAFKAVTIAILIAQAELELQYEKITSAAQVMKLDETVFTPGRDLCGGRNHSCDVRWAEGCNYTIILPISDKPMVFLSLPKSVQTEWRSYPLWYSVAREKRRYRTPFEPRK